MSFTFLWQHFMPEIVVAATALLVVLCDLVVERKGLLSVISLAGIGCAFGLTVSLVFSSTQEATGPAALLSADNLAVFMRFIFLGLAALIVLASTDYVDRMHDFHGEYHALILLSTVGMMLLVASTNLITIFVSLELTSVPIYALAGFLKDQRSTESSLKYLLLSAVNSAMLLYGLALLFGFTGTTSLAGVAQAVGGLSASGVWREPGLILGLMLVIAGFGFKVAAVPFQMWAPDVYEGSPTPVTLLLSAGSKLAGFAILLRVLISAFDAPPVLSQGWGMVIAVLAALGMTLGNLLAIPQTNIKRLLAYSGIAHSGYMLIAVAAAGMSTGASAGTRSALFFYMLAFALAEVVAFAAITVASQHLSDNIADYAGLGKRSPWLAATLTLGLISLTGIPPAAGFMAKFYLFTQAVNNGLLWLVIIAVLNTIISAYYYLRVARVMWQGEPIEGAPIVASFPPRLALLITALGVLALGLLPAWGVKLAEFGAKILSP